MPQVYRRHSEHTQRPPPEPRRRSSLAPTDADDSIVLSDIVRTGEASRLRRRGAMRLDHGLARPSSVIVPPVIPTPNQAPSTSRMSLSRPIRPSTPPWVTLNSYVADEDTFSGGEWREWNFNEDGRAEGSSGTGAGGGMQLDEVREEGTQDKAKEETGYMLFCGGEEADTSCLSGESSTAFEPSLLPVCPLSPSSSTRGPARVPRRTNGCGAVVHMRAFPQRPRGVWVGKQEATEVVVGLDATYFESAVVAKMMKSACGCIREGIGCAVCGNTLGTRYLPCQAASEGIFARHTPNAPTRPSKPPVPCGASYWHSRSSPAGSRSPASFYVYTFFADHVSSTPGYSFPPQPKRATPVYPQPAVGIGAGQPWLSSEGPTYSYRWSSSPRPISPLQVPNVPSRSASPTSSATWSPVFARPPSVQVSAPTLTRPLQPRTPPPRTPPPQPRVAEIELFFAVPDEGGAGQAAGVEAYTRPVTPDGDTGRREAEGEGELDPDGVRVGEEMIEDPSSPDKTGSEVMVWPGR